MFKAGIYQSKGDCPNQSQAEGGRGFKALFTEETTTHSPLQNFFVQLAAPPHARSAFCVDDCVCSGYM